MSGCIFVTACLLGLPTHTTPEIKHPGDNFRLLLPAAPLAPPGGQGPGGHIGAQGGRVCINLVYLHAWGW